MHRHREVSLSAPEDRARALDLGASLSVSRTAIIPRTPLETAASANRLRAVAHATGVTAARYRRGRAVGCTAATDGMRAPQVAMAHAVPEKLVATGLPAAAAAAVAAAQCAAAGAATETAYHGLKRTPFRSHARISANEDVTNCLINKYSPGDR